MIFAQGASRVNTCRCRTITTQDPPRNRKTTKALRRFRGVTSHPSFAIQGHLAPGNSFTGPKVAELEAPPRKPLMKQIDHELKWVLAAGVGTAWTWVVLLDLWSLPKLWASLSILAAVGPLLVIAIRRFRASGMSTLQAGVVAAAILSGAAKFGGALALTEPGRDYSLPMIWFTDLAAIALFSAVFTGPDRIRWLVLPPTLHLIAGVLPATGTPAIGVCLELAAWLSIVGLGARADSDGGEVGHQ